MKSINISKLQSFTVALSAFAGGAMTWEGAHSVSATSPAGIQWALVVVGGIFGGLTALGHLYQTPPNNPAPPAS